MGKKAKQRFQAYIKSLPTDGSAGDINQISRTYIQSGQGGSALQAQLASQDALRQAQQQADAQVAAQKAAQEALAAQNKKLADLQAERNAQAKKATEEAQRQAAITEARRQKLAAQRVVGTGTGRGGLKLKGIKDRTARASRRSRRASLSMNQVNLAQSLQAALKQRALNLG